MVSIGTGWSSHMRSRDQFVIRRILDAVAGAMPGDPYSAPPPQRPFLAEVGADPGRLRIGLMTGAPAGGPLHPDCVTATQDAARLLQSLGHHVEESYPAAFDELQACLAQFSTLLMSWVAATLDEFGERTGKTVGRDAVEEITWTYATMGRAITAAQYLHAVEWLHAFTRRMASWWAGGFDVLLTPTLAAPPPRLGELVPPPGNPLAGGEKAFALIPFTPQFNVTGQPAMSLPLYWNGNGLPIGVQLIAGYGREDVLIRVAAQLEHARPWRGRRPSVHA